jgi:hypothetical protein
MLGDFGKAVEEARDEQDPVPERTGFTLAGEVFCVEGDIGFIPFGKFAQAAISGLDTADMEGVAALMDMMQDIVGDMPDDPGDADEGRPAVLPRTKEQEWARFCFVSTKAKAKASTLLEIIGAVFAGESGLPTQPPSDSSDGSSQTETSASSKRKSSRSRASSPATIAARAGFEPVTDDLIREMGG